MGVLRCSTRINFYQIDSSILNIDSEVELSTFAECFNSRFSIIVIHLYSCCAFGGDIYIEFFATFEINRISGLLLQ